MASKRARGSRRGGRKSRGTQSKHRHRPCTGSSSSSSRRPEVSSENDDETSDEGEIPFMPYLKRITQPPPRSRRWVIEESETEQVDDGKETGEASLDESLAGHKSPKVENNETELLPTSPRWNSNPFPRSQRQLTEEPAMELAHDARIPSVAPSNQRCLKRRQSKFEDNKMKLLAPSPKRQRIMETPMREDKTQYTHKETPTRLRITMKPMEKDTEQNTHKKTQEEEFDEVERLMSASIASRALGIMQEPMTRQGGKLSIGRPRHLPGIPPVPHKQRMQPSQAVPNDRINAFRGQLEAAGGFVGTRIEASYHLRRYNWDVDSAISEWQREHQRRLGDIEVDGDERDEFSEEEELNAHRPMIARRTGEEERRDAIEVLVQRLRKASNRQDLTLTRYEAIGLLHINRFDIDEAVESYFNSDTGIDWIREMYQPFRRRNPSQRQQDLRLAKYLDITAANDWFTARELLKNLGWDLAKSLAMWQQNRVHHVPHPDTVRRGRGKQAKQGVDKGFRCDTEGKARKDEERLNERANVLRVLGEGDEGAKVLFKNEEELESGLEDDDADRDYRDSLEGAPVGPRGIATIGAPSPDLLSIEFVRNGEYTRSRWSSGRYDFATHTEEVESPARLEGSRRRGKIAFDWNDSEHIKDLNTWRNQRYCRLKGERESERVAWLPVEQDFVRELHHQLKAQKLIADPHCFDEKRKMMITTKTKEDWVKRFNDKFAGKVVEGHISEGRRPARSWGSIQAQRSRLQDLCEEFNFNYSEPHPDSPRQPSFIKMTPNDDEDSKVGGPRSLDRSRKRKRGTREGSDDEKYVSKTKSEKEEEDSQGPSKRFRWS
ncbi:MAG: hypothetical protein Q9160_007031 [Pyrenula sp. 1 TL-2023]